MQKKRTYLVGLVNEISLKNAENNLHSIELNAFNTCDALEIRYDFFDEEFWPTLSERVRNLVPQKMQIGTIRLKCDGGNFENDKANERMHLWQKILTATQKPEWLDLERNYLCDYAKLNAIVALYNIKILVSEHNFLKIPTESELETFATEVMQVNAHGLKVAAMSNSYDDCNCLYDFAKKYSKKFELFAAFGMGEFGRASRVNSLKAGANLTYASVGRTDAPGQISANEMRCAIDKLIANF